MENNVQKKATEFLEKLKEKERLELRLKELNKQITTDSQELYDLMEEEKVDSIEIEGIKFTPTVMQDFVLADNEARSWDEHPEFFKWLKEIGEDSLIRTKETVPWNTRKKFLKEWVEENNPLPPFIKEVFFNTIKYNKSAIKRLVLNERNRNGTEEESN